MSSCYLFLAVTSFSLFVFLWNYPCCESHRFRNKVLLVQYVEDCFSFTRSKCAREWISKWTRTWPLWQLPKFRRIWPISQTTTSIFSVSVSVQWNRTTSFSAIFSKLDETSSSHLWNTMLRSLFDHDINDESIITPNGLNNSFTIWWLW